MTYEEIKTKADTIRQTIEKPTGRDDIEALTAKLDDLTNISGTAAETHADAVELWREAERKAFDDLVEGEERDLLTILPPSALTKLIKAKAGKFEALVKRCERLDTRVGSAQEAIRTRLSFIKMEIEKGLR